MKLSKLKIAAFFLTLLLMGFLLYPRGLFLGYIYEGLQQLESSETYYLDYLKKNPLNKFATLRLANLYERMGKPSMATPILKELYDYRRRDWDVATRYLDHLRDIHQDDLLYKTRLEIARYFMALPRFPQEGVHELLNEAYAYAAWKQNVDDMYAILADLIRVARNKADYEWVLNRLDFDLKQTDKVIQALKTKVAENPDDMDATGDLANVYAANRRFAEARAVLAEAQQRHPNNIDLLQSQVFVEEKEGDYAALIPHIEQLLAHTALDPEEAWNYRKMLGSAFEKTRAWDKALMTYRHILDHAPDDPENWLSVIGLLDTMGRVQEELQVLQEYLAQFPEDAERQKLRVELYLYRLKDVGQIPLYLQFVKSSHDERIALDVATMLADAHEWGAAWHWLETVEPLFPKSVDLTRMMAVVAGERKDLPAAAQAWKKLVALKPQTATIQEEAGRELYFLNLASTAYPYLQTATQLGSTSAWYWRMEVESTLANKAAAVESAHHVVDQLLAKTPLTENDTRMLLRAKGICCYSKTLLAEYEDAIQQYPRNMALRSDWVDVLFDHQQTQRATTAVAEFARDFPQAQERHSAFEIRLAVAREDWPHAIRLLKAALQKEPQNLAYKRDLADAQLHEGFWWEAMANYETVQAETGGGVEEPLWQLHHDYDHRATPYYRYTSYGSTTFMEWGARYSGYLTPRWSLAADATLGRFKASDIAYTGNAGYGRVTMGYHGLHHWAFKGGLGWGTSEARTTVSPSFTLQYKPTEDLQLEAGYTYRELRSDFSQAVAAGTIMDTGKFSYNYIFRDRIAFFGRYEWERDVISGASAHSNTIEPNLAFILVKKPYLALGYQYSFVRVNSTGDFMTRVPLVPKVNANYLTGIINGRVARRLLLEGGFYVGDDTARNLNIQNGDLFGLRGNLEWAVSSWLDLMASYEFGRQRYLDIPGYSHILNVGLSGHWK